MKSQGFTLIELIIAGIIVSVLLAFALPSFQSLVQANQVSSCSNKLVGAIQYAKSEAVSSRRSVAVVADALAAVQPAFRVGTDADANGAIEDADLMQAFACEGQGVTITPDPELIYGPSGFRTDGNGQVVFTACNEIKKGNQVTVSSGGGVSTAKVSSC